MTRDIFVQRLYAALVSTIVLAIIGALAFWAKQPWLFPSLGPTVFLQTVTPNDRGSKLWNTFVGHAAGVCAGFLALSLMGLASLPPTIGVEPLAPARAGATALAVGATIGIQYILKATHPPAAATTMLITLGAMEPSWRSVGVIAIGVALVSAFGEAARLLHPGRSN